MFPIPQKNQIILPIATEGLYEITITSKDNKTVFSDCIISKNKKIILTGFSRHLYNVTILPILLHKTI
jgi:hypothetical protein